MLTLGASGMGDEEVMAVAGPDSLSLMIRALNEVLGATRQNPAADNDKPFDAGYRSPYTIVGYKGHAWAKPDDSDQLIRIFSNKGEPRAVYDRLSSRQMKLAEDTEWEEYLKTTTRRRNPHEDTMKTHRNASKAIVVAAQPTTKLAKAQAKASDLWEKVAPHLKSAARGGASLAWRATKATARGVAKGAKAGSKFAAKHAAPVMHSGANALESYSRRKNPGLKPVSGVRRDSVRIAGPNARSLLCLLIGGRAYVTRSGSADDISVFKDGNLIVVLSVNKAAEYIGLDVFDSHATPQLHGIPDREMPDDFYGRVGGWFLQGHEVEAVLGKGAFRSRPSAIASKLFDLAMM